MTDLEGPLHLLLPILERRAYAASKDDREAAARMAAIANLPIGWLFDDPRRYRDDLILRATGLDGTRSRCQAARPRMLDGRWRSSWLHSGAGRLIRWPGAVTEDAMGRLRGVALLSSGP